MEMEVAVEKNQRIKMFGLNSTESHDTDDDIFGGGDGQGPTNEKSVPPGPTFTHKLPQMLKIAIIGDSIAGKTVICEAFCKKNFTPLSKYTMTCGVQPYGKCISSSEILTNENSSAGHFQKPDEKLNLVLLDSAGQELYREYLPKYWEKLDAVMLVIDLTSPTALETGHSWIELAQVSLTSPLASQFKRLGVVVGNKMDLKDERVIDSEAGKAFATAHNMEYFECSVRNNAGFEEPFHFMAKEWFDLNQNRQDRVSSTMFKGQSVEKDQMRQRRP